MWNGTNVTPVGSTHAIVCNPKNHKRYSIEFVIFRETFTMLIGARAAQQMKLIKINNSNFITASPTRPSQPEVHLLRRLFRNTQISLSVCRVEYINMASYLPIAEERLEEIRRETRNDPSLQELKCVITLGWPEDKSKVAPQVHPFFSIRDELTIQDGLIFRGQRVVVPQSLRPMIKTKPTWGSTPDYAERESVFWPGFSAEIKQMVETCETCRKFETSPQKEPLVSHDVPLRPWEKIGVDIFELNGKEYLTTVDYYSNFWEIDKLPTDAKATTVIAKLKDHFARYGIPDQVVTDNGPQFKSQEFANFAAAYEFEHTPTSPYNSKGNGKVESAVKTAKRLLCKATDAGTDPYLSILEHRTIQHREWSQAPLSS